MCGIAGIFKPDSYITEEDKIILKNMVDTIRHRGPDDEGVYESRHCIMGHRRLAIIDLIGGRQPMFNEDKSIVVTYNGEIYNYKQLREILVGRGHIFSTESDTEVIIHAYEEWQENCFIKFDGMFAIAIFDNNNKTLFLARDRLGMKPLYYWHKKNILLWGSEIKAILCYDEVKPCPDEHTICDFITFQNTVDEKTFFKDIVKLQPGYFAKISDTVFQIRKYWDLHFPNQCAFKDINEALNIYENTFRDAVKRHLISDVEIGSCLSGGFDSPSVAFWASRFLNYPLKTFTGFFSAGRKYDERNVTRVFNRLINAQEKEIEITARDFRENIEKVIYHLDEPTLGSGALPHYMVAREVSKYVKVVLTGHGGDELFAGYQVYKAAFYKDLLETNPLQFLGYFWKNRPDEIGKTLYFSFAPFLYNEVKYGLFNMFNENQRDKLFTNDFLGSIKGYSPLENLETKYLKGKKFTNTERTLYLYLKTYLPTLFIQEDKVGMAHSIESRMPICDNKMIELSTQIPYQLKLYKNNLKYLTRAVMKKYLPREFYRQPKMGFPTPIARWFKMELKDFIYDILISTETKENGIFELKYLKKLLDAHFRWSNDTLYDYVRANRIYSLLSIEIWLRLFIK